MDINEALGKRMKQLANERGITLNEVIKRAGINQSTISEITSGRSKHPRVSTIQKFCNGCGISIGEFFTSDYFNPVVLESDEKENLEDKKNTRN